MYAVWDWFKNRTSSLTVHMCKHRYQNSTSNMCKVMSAVCPKCSIVHSTKTIVCKTTANGGTCPHPYTDNPTIKISDETCAVCVSTASSGSKSSNSTPDRRKIPRKHSTSDASSYASESTSSRESRTTNSSMFEYKSVNIDPAKYELLNPVQRACMRMVMPSVVKKMRN